MAQGLSARVGSAVNHVDATALEMLEELEERLGSRGIALYKATLKAKLNIGAACC